MCQFKFEWNYRRVRYGAGPRNHGHFSEHSICGVVKLIERLRSTCQIQKEIQRGRYGQARNCNVQGYNWGHGLAVKEAETRAQRQQLQTKAEQLAWRQAEIERLQLLIAKLWWMQFGRRWKKLNWQIERLELLLDAVQTAQAETRADSPSPEATEHTAER